MSETNENKTTSREFVSNAIDFVKALTNFKTGADVEGTIEGIKRDIDFKGHNVYILICSIIIASIGLNVNSVAAIIGAMLISPLMGPILGMGLAIGTHDFKVLTRSLKSFGVAVAVSLIASSIYFFLTPIKGQSSELLARTTPTLLDAFIAIFGGFAGIIAGSRKEKSTVIPGVAIATALMPPLCTAGYGIANLDAQFFFGGFYLFLINSIFISISTFVVVKYLDFPIVTFVDPKREKKYKSYIIAIIFIVLIPSGLIFWKVIKQSFFLNQVNKYVIENFDFERTQIVNQKITFNDTVPRIDIFVMGEVLSPELQIDLSRRLKNYGLEDAKLKIHQAGTVNDELAEQAFKEIKSGIIEDLYQRNESSLRQRDEEIKRLQDLVTELSKDSVPLNNLFLEAKVQFENIESLSFGYIQTKSETAKKNDRPLFIVKWKSENPLLLNDEEKLKKWLRIRLQNEKVELIRKQ
jgi:uncharacterized hydrophobic protein (TIGR00271 family)